MDNNISPKSRKVSLVVCPLGSSNVLPLALPSLASFLRINGYDVKCWDFNIRFIEEIRGEKKQDLLDTNLWNNLNVDRRIREKLNEFIDKWAAQVLQDEVSLIGFSTNTVNLYSNLELAKAIKKRKPSVKIVFGGPECSYNWQQLCNIPEIDFIVIGEGEYPLLEILNHLNKETPLPLTKSIIVKGETFKEPVPFVNKHLDTLPLIDYSFLQLEKYRNRDRLELPLFSSIGCQRHCTFCSRGFLQGDYRYKSSNRVVNELEMGVKIYNSTNFYFVDSLINGNMAQLQNWLTSVIDTNLQINWRCNAVFHAGMKKEVLGKMYKAGCRSINFGLESGSPEVLQDMKKYSNIEMIEHIIKDSHDIGIRVTCFIILGYPSETETDFEATLDFIDRNKNYIDSVTPNICYIGPGTFIYDNRNMYNVIGEADYWFNPLSTPQQRSFRYKKMLDLLSKEDISIINSV